MKKVWRVTSFLGAVTIWAAAGSGCTGRAGLPELHARATLSEVEQRYRPQGAPPHFSLTESSPLEDILLYAVLNNPAVEIAYHEWHASVAQIVAARSLPDPRLTFESDIQRMVMSLMPGLMFELPGPGKLSLAGEAASAESARKYYEFVQAVLTAAAEAKSAYYRLQALEDTIEVNKRTLALVHDLEAIATAQHSAGKVTLQDVLRARIERDKLETVISNLVDSRESLEANYQAALGHAAPSRLAPTPARGTFTNSAPILSEAELLERGLRNNPVLQGMEAEIRRAEAEVALARRAVVPDFGGGLEIDLKPSRPILNPQISMTLPIWRDRIAADIEAAVALQQAARARRTRQEILLAVDFAAMLFVYKESVRNERLFAEKLLPQARRSVEIARSGYIGGKSSFIDFLEAERTLLAFELSRVEARLNRELAAANLSLTVAAIPPEGAPLPDAPPDKRSGDPR